jgi:recombinational DNA repair protein RecT
MAKKTTLRRLCKLLPLASEIAEHIEKDSDVVLERDITPKPTASLALPSMQEVAE